MEKDILSVYKQQAQEAMEAARLVHIVLQGDPRSPYILNLNSIGYVTGVSRDSMQFTSLYNENYIYRYGEYRMEYPKH